MEAEANVAGLHLCGNKLVGVILVVGHPCWRWVFDPYLEKLKSDLRVSSFGSSEVRIPRFWCNPDYDRSKNSPSEVGFFNRTHIHRI